MRVNRHGPVQHVLNFIFLYLLLCVMVTLVFALTLLFKNNFDISFNNFIRITAYTLGYIAPVMSVPAFLVSVGSFFLLEKGVSKKELMVWSAIGGLLIAAYVHLGAFLPGLWWLAGIIMGAFFYLALIRLSQNRPSPQDI